MKLSALLSNAAKGFAMGAANVVPGVSGGTIALITGIYSKIVDALSACTDNATWKALFNGRFKEFWERINGSFVLALAAGILISILSLAKLVTWALAEYPVLTWAFFFGLILASAFYMLAGIKGWKAADALFLIAGIGLGLAVCFLTPTKTPDALWFIFIAGAVSICTMILPGISGSFVMQILGKYEYIMKAIDVSAFNWPVIIAFGAGCVVGILAFAKFLKWLLARWEKQTMIVLVGFVLGTLLRVWPWYDMQAVEAAGHGLQITGAVAFCLLGIAVTVLIQKLSSKKG